MRAFALLAVLGLVACTKPCPLEDFALLPAGAVDCGTLSLPGTAAASQAAHDCALDAATGHKPFRLIWQAAGVDSRVRLALTGTGTELHSFDFDGDIHGGGGEGSPEVVSTSCASLAATPTCTVTDRELCLDCVGASASAVLCTNR